MLERAAGLALVFLVGAAGADPQVHLTFSTVPEVKAIVRVPHGEGFDEYPANQDCVIPAARLPSSGKWQLIITYPGYQEFRPSVDGEEFQKTPNTLGPFRLKPESGVINLVRDWWLCSHPLGRSVPLLACLALGFGAFQRIRLRSEAHRRQELEAVKAGLADATDPLIGTSVGGYILTGTVGAGGMGSVYRGQPEADLRGRALAVKVIRHDLASDDQAVKRFLREMAVTRDLVHPGIVRLEACGEQDGLLYMAMELVSGAPLKKLIRPGGLPWKEVLAMLRPVLQACQYAHERGVVHRDLKPHNIMIDASGRPRVLDFGLATRDDLSRMTSTGKALGTPAYLPPELLFGRKADALSDQYSLGVLAYELLTGGLPFSGPDSLAVAMLHATQPAPAPRSLRPDLPASLERVVLKMMRKDPLSRFGSLSEVLGALDRAEQEPDAFAEFEAEALTLPVGELRPVAPVAPASGDDDGTETMYT